MKIFFKAEKTTKSAGYFRLFAIRRRYITSVRKNKERRKVKNVLDDLLPLQIYRHKTQKN